MTGLKFSGLLTDNGQRTRGRWRVGGGVTGQRSEVKKRHTLIMLLHHSYVKKQVGPAVSKTPLSFPRAERLSTSEEEFLNWKIPFSISRNRSPSEQDVVRAAGTDPQLPGVYFPLWHQFPPFKKNTHAHILNYFNTSIWQEMFILFEKVISLCKQQCTFKKILVSHFCLFPWQNNYFYNFTRICFQ